MVATGSDDESSIGNILQAKETRLESVNLPRPRGATVLQLQYLPEKWYKFHYFDTALFWSYEGQSHEVNIATQSYFQRSFWWAFKKYGICNHLRENWEPLKKWVHFPWTLRLLEPFQVDFRQKPFLIRFSTFIWPGYHEIILEFGQLYWELERNFQKLPQIFI